MSEYLEIFDYFALVLNVLMRRILLIFALFFNVHLQAQLPDLTFISYTVNDGLSQNSVYSSFQDRDGFLWFGTADGLCRYDGYQFRSFKLPIAQQMFSGSNYFWGKITQHENGDIYFGTHGGLLRKLSGSDSLELFIPSNDTSLYSGTADIIGFRNHDELWFFNQTNTLFCVNVKTRKTSHFKVPKILEININQSYRAGIFLNNNLLYFNSLNGIGSFDVLTKSFQCLEAEFFKQNELVYSYDRIVQWINPLLIGTLLNFF